MHALKLIFAVSGLLLLMAGAAQAAEARAAVAANFRAPMAELAQAFEAETGHRLTVSAGSTGQLFAQIANGAPFDVFLSADQARPARLVELGLAAAERPFTYAEGRLFLLLRDGAAPDGGTPDLGAVRRISIANPRTAPYGAAAMQVLDGFAFPAGRPQLAEAQSIAGVTAAFAAGAVDAGFAAYSTIAPSGSEPPAGWLVPSDLHAPIRQDAVLLARAADNAAAVAFLDWLQRDAAREIIRRFGYHVP